MRRVYGGAFNGELLAARGVCHLVPATGDFPRGFYHLEVFARVTQKSPLTAERRYVWVWHESPLPDPETVFADDETERSITTAPRGLWRNNTTEKQS